MITKEFVARWSPKYKYKPQLEQQILQYFTKKHPYIDRNILLKILEWKANRVKAKLENDERFIKDVTRIAFSTKNERLRIEILTLLKGVKYRVASTILHFRFPDKYPIMDWRAWDTLKAEDEFEKGYNIKNDFEHWKLYFSTCRKIVKRKKIGQRGDKSGIKILDQALWQFSKDKSIKKAKKH